MTTKTKERAPEQTTAGPTAAELEKRIGSIETQVGQVDAQLKALAAEKEQLVIAAYSAGDEAARARLEEINTAVRLEELRRADMEAALAQLRPQLAAARERERFEDIERLEELVQDFEQHARGTADALLDVAKTALRAAVDRHRDVLQRWSTAHRRLSALDPDAARLEFGLLELDRLALMVVKEARLPDVVLTETYRHDVASEGSQAYLMGKRQGAQGEWAVEPDGKGVMRQVLKTPGDR